jgi:inward rectifier potassium channel
MDMSKETFDPGLTQVFGGRLRRFIGKDGAFNVRRKGKSLQNLHFYQFLINLPWPQFIGFGVLSYLAVNTVFALLYLAIGIEHLQGAQANSMGGAFLSAFFFSVQTLTTVGYGNIAPTGVMANLLASFEAMIGLMGFAFGAGLLYGRFSRPTARLLFSDKALIAPYQEGSSLQFRVANQRANAITDIEAKVLLMTVQNEPRGQHRRKYDILKLERPTVYFLPLTWTVVHPIDEESPFFHMTPIELAAQQAEILILIKGFDDTFSQVVHSRYSYRYDEILWGARFKPAFHINEKGDLVLDVDKIDDLERVELPSGGGKK